MEFPITCKRLQNYREDEATEVNAKQRLAKIIEKICKDIENILLTTDERKYVYRIEGSVYGKLPSSPKRNSEVKFENEIFFNSKKEFVREETEILKKHKVELLHRLQERSILPDIVDTLKTLFPDSNVVVDPLITYIIIDWS